MDMAIIVGLGSDIGRELASRFAGEGWTVKGTHRNARTKLPADIESTTCDLSSPRSVSEALDWLSARCQGWRLFVVAAGTEEPIGPFWDCNADEWERAIQVNALAPLRMLRGLYSLRDARQAPAVALFSGAGTNAAAPAYSAYCGSKILLIKMCELLDAESADTSFFIIGPGIVRTKIHEETLRAGARAGSNYQKVAEFLGSAAEGTGHDEIYACLRWCMRAGKHVVGGRNIALVQDAWRSGVLEPWLAADPNRYKLRRFGNEIGVKEGA